MQTSTSNMEESTCSLGKIPREAPKLFTFARSTWDENTSKRKSPRGAFIVIEGTDKVGKTTLAKKLVNWLLQGRQQPATYLKFPYKHTEIGRIIDSHLTQVEKPDDVPVEVLHLLFSANRWEMRDSLLAALYSGMHVVCDRYSYSGIAYTTAMNGSLMEWAAQTEYELPEPDLVLYLHCNERVAKKRGDFGLQRFEHCGHLATVNDIFTLMVDDQFWCRIKTDNINVEEVFEAAKAYVDETLQAQRYYPIDTIDKEAFAKAIEERKKGIEERKYDD